MIFAISLVPLLGFVGAAVDFTRVNAARSSMQGALDSAALMVSKDLSSNPSLSAADITSKATTYFNALYTNKSAGPVTVTASYTTNTQNGSTVTVNGASSVTTDFMKLLGSPNMPINGGATTTWGSTRMRVAMALDVTGSMNSDGKLTAMKNAAKSLIDTLSANSRMTEDVYIAIVPFAQMVNVGTAYKSASWLKWDQLGTCNNTNFSMSSEACQAYAKKYPYTNTKWTSSTNKSSWKGCVEDRDESYDTTKDPASDSSTNFPAMFYVQQGIDSCPPQILPMTSAYGSTNTKTLKDMIDGLDASGGTNQLIGMAWAWQMLQTGDPFPTPAKDSNYKYTDAIILLSDGLNTGSRMYGDGTSWEPKIDARQQLLCDNIKAPVGGKQQTVIYTIQVNTDGDPESAVLKYCADSGNFYPTSTASGIAAAFTAIGNSLNKLRVSR